MFFSVKRGMGTLVLGAFALIPMVSQAAVQGTAGNTIIRNSVQVSYQDAVAITPITVTASVDSRVNTINVAPNLTHTAVVPLPVPGGTATTDGTGATRGYFIDALNQSNGPASIAVSAADNAATATNITLSATIPSVAPNVLFLGATIIDPSDPQLGVAQTILDGNSITFAVPNDGGVPTDAAITGGAAGDGILNALKAGDDVDLYDGTNFFGNFSVVTVADPAVPGTGAIPTGSIQLLNNSGATIHITPAAGWMIVEEKAFTMTVTQGVVADPAQAASWDSVATADMGGLTGSVTVTTSANQGVLNITKFVRNITNPNGGVGGTVIAINGNGGQTYFTSGVSANPGDVLEYLLKVDNTGLGATNSVVVTDRVPDYTQLFSGATYGTAGGVGAGTEIFAVIDNNTDTQNIAITVQNTDNEDALAIPTANAVGSGDAAGTVPGSSLSFYIGSGNDGSTATGGAVSGMIHIVYRIQVN